jgi:hypothetical protein
MDNKDAKTELLFSRCGCGFLTPKTAPNCDYCNKPFLKYPEPVVAAKPVVEAPKPVYSDRVKCFVCGNKDTPDSSEYCHNCGVRLLIEVKESKPFEPCQIPLQGKDVLEDIKTVRQIVAKAIKEDKECRRPGVTEGIYPLSALMPFQRLRHGVPMIRTADSEGRFTRAVDNNAFKFRLQKFAPFLQGLDYQKLGLRLAGGAASALLMRSTEDLEKDESAFHDFDLFLVGHKTDKEALAAIDALAVQLGEHWKENMSVHRTQGCVSFHTHWAAHRGYRCGEHMCPAHHWHCAAYDPKHPERLHDPPRSGCLVQVVLRRYSTNAEVIHGFDLGSSAFLWDGEQVLMTALGKLAAEHGANVLNLDARRGSHEHRIARYFGRGFDLIVPDLDCCALMVAGGRMPYLYAEGLEYGADHCACSLWAKKLHATRPDRGDHGEWISGTTQGERNIVAVSNYAYTDIPYGNQFALTSRNLKTLRALSNATQVSGATTAQTEQKNDVAAKVAQLCGYVAYKPGIILTEVHPWLDGEKVGELAMWAWRERSDTVDLNRLRRILGPDRATMLVLEYMSTGKRPDREQFMRHGADIAAQLNEIASLPFVFMRVEDKTALTGPFPRELVSKEVWYGDAMRFSA